MPNIINGVPPKRSETETPTVNEEHGEHHPLQQEKMQRSASRAAHEATETEQYYDMDKDQFSNLGTE